MGITTLFKPDKTLNDFISIEDKIKEINAKVKDRTSLFNPYVTKTALEDFNKEKEKQKVSSKVASELKSTNKIENFLDANSLVIESESREKLYNAFRSVLRFFPELANAIRLTGEHVSNAEGVSSLPTYNISLKLNIEESEDETIKEEKTNLALILDKFKFDKKVFEKSVDLVREGDYFVEIINVDKIEIGIETDSTSPDKNKIKLLTEATCKTYDTKLIENANVLINKGFIKNSYDLETSFLIEQAQENGSNDSDETSVGNSITEKMLSGIVLRKHKPEYVCVLTINNEVFGYVIVSSEANLENKDEITSMFTNLTSDKTRNGVRQNKQEVNKIFSQKMSQMILAGIDFSDESNSKLINKVIANNIEIKKMIYNNLMNENASNIRFVSAENMVHYKVPSVVEIDKTYGESSLYSMLPDIKDYIKLKKTLTNYMLVRSVEKERITVQVDIDGDAETAVNEVVLAFKNKEMALESALGDVDSVGRQISVFDRIFIPKINGETPIEIDTVPNVSINIDRETLKQFKNEIIAGIRTPASLMDSTDNSYHTSVAQESMSYAMTILELQKIITNGDTETANKIMKLLGKNINSNYVYQLAPPTSLMNEVLDNNISRARTIIDFVYEMYIDDTATVKTAHIDKFKLAKKVLPALDWKAFDKIYDESTTEYFKAKTALPADEGGI